MKFSALVAIVSEDIEEDTVDIAKKYGASGATIINAKGISAVEKKTFFGLTYQGSQSVIIFILERKLSVKIMKLLLNELKNIDKKTEGLVFTLPIEHLAGIDFKQLNHFENKIREEFEE